MTIELPTDRDEMMGTTSFASSATYTHEGNDSEISGIFDDEYQSLGEGFPGTIHEGSVPVFHVHSAKLPTGAASDDSISIDGHGDFTVVEVKPDGTGMTILRLQQQ